MSKSPEEKAQEKARKELLSSVLKFTPEQLRKWGDLKRRGARGTHVSKRRKGTRRANKQRAIDDE